MSHRSTSDMLRVLRLAVVELTGRIDAGKLAVVEQAIGHIREQRAVIDEAQRALPNDLRTHRKLRDRMNRLLRD